MNLGYLMPEVYLSEPFIELEAGRVVLGGRPFRAEDGKLLLWEALNYQDYLDTHLHGAPDCNMLATKHKRR